MQRKSDLFVFTKAKDLCKYIFTITDKSPKKYRATLVRRLQDYILDIVENIYMANNANTIEERQNRQEKAKATLGMLDYFAQLAFEQECILFKQYEQITKQQAECLLYLKKWINSTSKNNDKQMQMNIDENEDAH